MRGAGFRQYLEELPEVLLQQVSEDYLWLAGLQFRGAPATEFTHRWECCRAEWERRGRSMQPAAGKAVTVG